MILAQFDFYLLLSLLFSSMSERRPFLLRGNARELGIILAKGKEPNDSVGKFFRNLSFIAGAPYMAVFASVFVRTIAGEKVPAVEALAGVTPWLINNIYTRLNSNYTQLPETEKLKIRKKISSPPISPVMDVISKVLDFPITKKTVIHRARVPRSIDVNQN